MSERSEFGLRAASGEERREPTRLHRVCSRPAKGPFGSFWVHPEGTRTRSGRKLCTRCSLEPLALPLLDRWIRRRRRPPPKGEDQVQGFRAVARLTFVLAKVSKTVFAGRDPPRYSRGGPLRFSDDGARSPNSLRSDMGCSTTPSPCDARLALRLDSSQKMKTKAKPSQASQAKPSKQKQKQRQRQRQRQNSKPDHCPAIARKPMPTRYASTVPVAYPSAPSNAPTGASDGWNTDATTGADAGPPMLLCEPIAK